MTTLWIIVAVFVVFAIGAGAAQIVSALGDKKISKDVRTNEDRLHTDPRENKHEGRD